MKYFDGDKKPLLDELSRLNYTATLDFPIIAIFDYLLEVIFCLLLTSSYETFLDQSKCKNSSQRTGQRRTVDQIFSLNDLASDEYFTIQGYFVLLWLGMKIKLIK